jgi:hypothetical protein
VLLCVAATSLVLLPGVWRWWRAPVEFDMTRLGSRRAEIDGARYWDRHADAVLGSYQTPTVVLTDSVDETRRVADALRQVAQRPGSTIARVLTLADLVPTDQAAKLPLIRALLAEAAPDGRPMGRWLATVPEDQRGWVARVLRESRVTTVTAADLPPRWQAPFRQPDGTLASQLVLVFPRLELDPGSGFLAHAAEVRATAAGPVPTARVAGAMVLTSDVLAAVSADGQTASWCCGDRLRPRACSGPWVWACCGCSASWAGVDSASTSPTSPSCRSPLASVSTMPSTFISAATRARMCSPRCVTRRARSCCVP